MARFCALNEALSAMGRGYRVASKSKCHRVDRMQCVMDYTWLHTSYFFIFGGLLQSLHCALRERHIYQDIVQSQYHTHLVVSSSHL